MDENENMEMSVKRKAEYYRKLIRFYRKYKKKEEGLNWEWSFDNK